MATTSALKSAHAKDSSLLYIQPRIGYQFPRFFQESQTSSYPGLAYGGAVHYKLSFGDDENDFGLAPVLSFLYGKFKNAANNSTQTETLTEKTYSAGLRFYIDHFFIQGHYSWVDINNIAQGQTNLAISDRTTGLGGAIGFELPISQTVQLEISGELNNASFQPKAGGFSTKAQYLRYGGFFGLSIAIPSAVPSTRKRLITEVD